MRIERTGDVAKLTPRVIAFLKKRLSAVSLDELESDVRSRIDYSCLSGLLAVELKTLEEDGSERMDNLTEELRIREDWPIFLGSAPMESFIRNMDDEDGLRRQVLNRVGRAIVNHLKKANRQLGAHSLAYPRKSQVRLVLLINEDHKIYDPHTVGYVLGHALRRTEGEELLYPNVDAVLYLSERHAALIEGRVGFPMMFVEGQPISRDLWKGAVVEHVIAGWAAWNDVPLHSGADGKTFTTIDAIPESAPRHERWRTDYRRRPYLRPLTREQLISHFNDVSLISLIGFLKEPPIRISREVMMRNMIKFTHLMVELGDRGIPATELNSALESDLASARRLDMPSEVVEWLVNFHQERDRREQAASGRQPP